MKLTRLLLIVLILCSPSLAGAVTRHYVHPGLTGGNNDGSSWTNAWRTFANVNWTTLQTEAASQPVYLYVKKGSTSTTALIIGGSGSSDTNRIYITTDSSDSGADPIVTGVVSGASVKFDSKSYLTISHIMSRYNHQGGFSGTDGSNIGSGIILEDCKAMNNGTDNNGNGIFFKGHDITVRRCEVGNTGGILEGWCHGIYVDVGSTAYIYDNLIYGSLHGNGIELKCNATVYRNKIYSNKDDGINVDDTLSGTTVTIYNNVIYSNITGGIRLAGDANTITAYIYGNSLYKNATESSGGYWGEINITSAQTLLRIKNNVIYAKSGGYTISSETDPQSDMECDYNIHYNVTTNPIYYDGSARSWSYWTTTLSHDVHGSNVDPKYVGPPANMTLMSNSPGIDAGMGAGDTYTYGLNPGSSWPSSVATLNQNSYGSGWEIGAFVYLGGDDPPYPPSGLRVVSQ